MPYTDQFDDLKSRVWFLSHEEQIHLARWLCLHQRPFGFNTGRWVQLKGLDSDYVSSKELRILNDNLAPYGMAIDIIQGKCTVKFTRESSNFNDGGPHDMTSTPAKHSKENTMKRTTRVFGKSIPIAWIAVLAFVLVAAAALSVLFALGFIGTVIATTIEPPIVNVFNADDGV